MENTPQVIWLISGYAGSGKDTTADILTNLLGQHVVTRDSFAGAVKDEVAALYDLDRAELDTTQGKAALLPNDPTKTVRDLIIHHAETTKTSEGDPAIWAKRIRAPNTPHWILSDWRFLDELLHLRMRFPHAALYTLRVHRPTVEPLETATEHELDSFICQYTIENSGSLLYIANQLSRILENHSHRS